MSTTIVHTSCDNTTPARITISGRVLVQNGNPAVGVTVNARERGLRSGIVLASAPTGRFGDYSLAFMIAGMTGIMAAAISLLIDRDTRGEEVPEPQPA